jgi:hypothetical protein
MTATIFFFLCIASPFLLIGGFWWLTILIFLLRVKETSGRIISVETSRTGKSSRTFAEFQIEDGKTVQFTEYTGRSMGLFEFLILIPVLLIRYLYQKVFNTPVGVTYEGDTVQVLYDPTNPSRAHIKNFHYLHARPLFVIMIGLLISISAIPEVLNFYSKIGEFLTRFFWWV